MSNEPLDKDPSFYTNMMAEALEIARQEAPRQDVLNMSVEEVADLILLKEKSEEVQAMKRRVEIEARTSRCQGLAQEIATLGMAGFLGDREVENWEQTVGKGTGCSRGWRLTEGWLVVGDNGVIYTKEKWKKPLWTFVAPIMSWILGVFMWLGLGQAVIAIGLFMLCLWLNYWFGYKDIYSFTPFNWEEDRSCLVGWLEEVKAEGLYEVAKARLAIAQGNPASGAYLQ